MTTQQRLLFLLDFPQEQRFAKFEEACYIRALAPTTAASYWTAFLSVEKTLGVSPDARTNGHTRIQRILDHRANQYPVAFPKPLTHEARMQFAERFRKTHFALVTLVEACWALGQRFGDFIQLAVRDITRDPETGSVKIKVCRGKTVAYTQPYTLVINPDLDIARNLLTLQQHSVEKGWRFLAFEDWSSEAAKAVSSATSNLLAAFDEELEIRSIRRGGLQHMAKMMVPVPTMLHFSKHASEQMLMRYLNWGEHAEAQNAEILKVSELMMTCC